MRDASTNWRRPALIGYLVIILTFGGLGGWSAVARLDSAVLGTGVVATESNRKTVQHLEGGIVSEILVREGQRVEQDELLIKLDQTSARANFAGLASQLYSLLAAEARLLTEREGALEVEFPREVLESSGLGVVKQAIADQQKQFAERRSSLTGQVGILEAKAKQYRTEIEGLQLERQATERQLGFVQSELKDLNYLLDKNLVSRSRVLALEREKSRLEGTIGRNTAEHSKALNGIAEAELQIAQLRQKFLEEVNTSVLETRQKLAEVRERLSVARDMLKRTEIRAPRAGVLQNLRVFTVGGVIRPGESLVEIAPENEELIVQGQINPIDIDSVKAGMQAEVRFPSFHTQILPLMLGRVISVSRDRLIDEQTKQPYFLARISVDEQSVPAAIRSRLSAGMPADIIIPTGERTVVSYIVRPLKDRVRKTMREY